MNNQTFLPEDYLAKKAEKRTNIVCLSLFVVVMFTVFGAFLVSNRQWSKVRTRRHEVNVEYERVVLQIEELNQLEDQKRSMLHKAELAAALIERVPRSILVADMINRMPPQLGLLELHLTSTKMKTRKKASTEGVGNLRDKNPKRGKTRQEAAVDARRIEAPRYDVEVEMVGVAPSDLEVAKYKGELSNYALLQDVALVYTEEKLITGRRLREFRLKMHLASGADVRNVEPLKVPRIRNPMLDTIRIGGTPAHNVPVRPAGKSNALPGSRRGD